MYCYKILSKEKNRVDIRIYSYRLMFESNFDGASLFSNFIDVYLLYGQVSLSKKVVNCNFLWNIFRNLLFTVPRFYFVLSLEQKQNNLQ